MSEPRLDQAGRRLAAIAALRQLRRLVDAERAQEAVKARWAGRLSLLLLLVGLCVAAYLALRPNR